MWVAGAVTTIVGLGAILWSRSVRGWVDDHPRWLYVGLLAVTSACIVLAEMWWTEKTRVRPQVGIAPSRQPTQRDKELFARFLNDFPPDRGAIIYLQEGFFGKQWYWSRLQEVDRFAFGWDAGVFFDDPEVEAARQDLLSACRRFISDASGESDPPGDNDDVARLKEARLRHGGQAEWQTTRDRLNEEADAVVKAHDTLHRVGRANHL